MLKGEITQLKDSECECENEKDINWTFPVLCTILFFIFLPLLLLSFSFVIGGVIICSIVASLGPEYSHLSLVLLISMLGIAFGLGWVPTYTAHVLNCWWWRFSD
jgi:hypothetical protein